MAGKKINLFVGGTPIYENTSAAEGSFVQLLDEKYYRISHYDQISPFFMSLVSASDHWLFIASTGGLTAGRINADSALFPYETEDKIIVNGEQTGSKTIIRVTRDKQAYLWEPFSERYAGVYRCQRNLYKNIFGNKLVFEEINHDLQLTMRTAWFTGDRFGFIRSSWLLNDGDSECRTELLDGLQNLLPYGANVALQSSMSNLMNAYKRSEMDPNTGLALYALSATISDRAEPSESLKAAVAWQVGLDHASYLLCSDQLEAYRSGCPIVPERDVRGKAGAYFVNAVLELSPDQSHHWRIVADVNQDAASIVRVNRLLQLERDSVIRALDEDIARGTDNLVLIVAAADGLQLTAEEMTTSHHIANVLFNVMRGGIFTNAYQIEREDLLDLVAVRNSPLLTEHAGWFAELPARFSIQYLRERAKSAASPDLIRLGYEYLPLGFSRRHGDPSRPWNAFSINLKQPDGSLKLDYQGNWRDIFQNWEPLAHSFPNFAEGMVCKFLNATTVDGYNPYRVTRDGIEWEIPDPENPWANIGYWGDHQIIYLQKLLEIVDNVHPGVLEIMWNQAIFAYANVPYRLRTYPEILADCSDTIEFDWQSERGTAAAVAKMGTDGRLIRDATGLVVHVTMTEKLLVLLLAKLTNLVPEGGIWMNTQRPEWNDANNALAGNGLSVVTVAYLRRFVAFWKARLENTEPDSFAVNSAIAALFEEVQNIFAKYQSQLEAGFNNRNRRAIMDDLGKAATAYRTAVYEDGLPEKLIELPSQKLIGFLALAQSYIEHTLRANIQQDGLTHSYNVLHLLGQQAVVENLYLMLEGQVALLSSGMLAPDEALALLHSMRHSALYRADLHTYMLYPDRTLPGFLQKNNISASQIAGSKLVSALTEAGDNRLLVRDEAGVYHFNGDFHNKDDVTTVLDDLAAEPAYVELAAVERSLILDLFETTFNHRAFTGRSGTFFAYEGLGSVYWHMVSKLLLAVQECYLRAEDDEAEGEVTSALAEAYYDIRQGLGFNKSPAEYGAFPADPYSHTPMGGGARQPGMTGQVKEEILTRLGELGVSVRQGRLCLEPTLLRIEEFLQETSSFAYIDVAGVIQTIQIPSSSIAFTFCQTPIIYSLSDSGRIDVTYRDGRTATMIGGRLDVGTTRHILERDGQIEMLRVSVWLPGSRHNSSADTHNTEPVS
ncbi:MAG TPA: hypothetical protein VFI27_16290 [candidate division Zixibacteria bacterium]|nr:hypothetical protein [candidate division Zixibacteria bacterium]